MSGLLLEWEQYRGVIVELGPPVIIDRLRQRWRDMKERAKNWQENKWAMGQFKKLRDRIQRLSIDRHIQVDRLAISEGVAVAGIGANPVTRATRRKGMTVPGIVEYKPNQASIADAKAWNEIFEIHEAFRADFDSRQAAGGGVDIFTADVEDHWGRKNKYEWTPGFHEYLQENRPDLANRMTSYKIRDRTVYWYDKRPRVLYDRTRHFETVLYMNPFNIVKIT